MATDQQSGIAQWEVQVHIVEAFNASDDFKNICTGGVHDSEAPATAAYPYLVIGDWTETPDNLIASLGRQVTSTLHIWDNYRGSKRAKAIGQIVTRILDQVPFQTDNWFANVVTLEYINNMLTQQDQMQHLILRFRYKLEKRAL